MDAAATPGDRTAQVDDVLDELLDAGFSREDAAAISRLTAEIVSVGFAVAPACDIAAALHGSGQAAQLSLDALEALLDAGAVQSDVARMARCGHLAGLPAALAAGVPVHAVLGLWTDASPTLLAEIMSLGVSASVLEAYARVLSRYLLPRHVPDLISRVGMPGDVLALLAEREATRESLGVLLSAGLDWDDIEELAVRGVRLRHGAFFAVPPTRRALADLDPDVRRLTVQLAQTASCPVTVSLPMALCLADRVDAATLARLIADGNRAYPAPAVLAARALDSDEVGVLSPLGDQEATALIEAHRARWPSRASRVAPEYLVGELAEAPVPREVFDVALSLMDRSVLPSESSWEPHLRLSEALPLAAALVGRPWLDDVLEQVGFGRGSVHLLALVTEHVAEAMGRTGRAPALKFGIDSRGEPVHVPADRLSRRVASAGRARASRAPASPDVSVPGGREP